MNDEQLRGAATAALASLKEIRELLREDAPDVRVRLAWMLASLSAEQLAAALGVLSPLSVQGKSHDNAAPQRKGNQGHQHKGIDQVLA